MIIIFALQSIHSPLTHVPWLEHTLRPNSFQLYSGSHSRIGRNLGSRSPTNHQWHRQEHVVMLEFAEEFHHVPYWIHHCDWPSGCGHYHVNVHNMSNQRWSLCLSWCKTELFYSREFCSSNAHMFFVLDNTSIRRYVSVLGALPVSCDVLQKSIFLSLIILTVITQLYLTWSKHIVGTVERKRMDIY